MIYILGITASLLTTLSSQPMNQQPPNITNNNINNIYVDSKTQSGSTAHAESSATNTTTLYNTISLRITNFIKMIQTHPRYQQIPDYKTLQSMLYAKRYTIAAGSAGIAYAAIATKSLHAQYLISQPLNWCHWKKHLSVEELRTCNQKELMLSLIHDIQIRHIDPLHPTDFISPCARFIHAIDAELQYIERIIFMGTISWKTKRFIFINDETIDKAKLHKQRLIYIKQLFITWAAQVNVIQATKQILSNPT